MRTLKPEVRLSPLDPNAIPWNLDRRHLLTVSCMTRKRSPKGLSWV